MDLWIRTQNREKLINVAYIDVSQLNEIGEYRLGGDGMFIGKYKSKERALEVLDEIQKILIGRLIIKTNRKASSEDLNRLANFFDTKYVINDNEFEFIQPEATNIIYEMPKE